MRRSGRGVCILILSCVPGRNHLFAMWKVEKARALETFDFAKQCVGVYKSIASSVVKKQSTVHLD